MHETSGSSGSAGLLSENVKSRPPSFFALLHRLATMDMMYEPHLAHHHPHHHNGDSQDSGSLLEELDKIAPIQSFDAFPKVRPLSPPR